MSPQDIFCELNRTFGQIKAFCASGKKKLGRLTVMPIKKLFNSHKEFMKWFRAGKITIIDDNEIKSGTEE